ncbi:hypothetical protein ACI65C_012883 [Semiaphis heraclei]
MSYDIGLFLNTCVDDHTRYTYNLSKNNWNPPKDLKFPYSIENRDGKEKRRYLISKRKRTEPNHLRNFHLETATGANYEEQVFSNENLQMAKTIDDFMNMDYENSQHFILHYKDIINSNIECLKAEMLVARNCLKKCTDGDDIKKIINKEVYPNLYKLMRVALTIPHNSNIGIM